MSMNNFEDVKSCYNFIDNNVEDPIKVFDLNSSTIKAGHAGELAASWLMRASWGEPKESYVAADYDGIIAHMRVFGEKLRYQASLLDETPMFKRGRIAREHLPDKHKDEKVVEPLVQMLNYFFLREISLDPEQLTDGVAIAAD